MGKTKKFRYRKLDKQQEKRKRRRQRNRVMCGENISGNNKSTNVRNHRCCKIKQM